MQAEYGISQCHVQYMETLLQCTCIYSDIIIMSSVHACQSQLLNDLSSHPVIYELVLFEELTLVEWGQTVDVDLTSL